MRHAQRARDALRQIPIDELIARVGRAGELYMNGTLPIGDGTQTPDEFVHAQSASTGLPERMCRANMKKNAFVLSQMRNILTSLTRGLSSTSSPPATARNGGSRSATRRRARCSVWCCRRIRPACTRSGCRSSRCRSAWCSSPDPQEPWTPYRMAEAFFAAGIPREAISIYPGQGDVGAAVLDSCARSLIFGGTPTVDRYRGNPSVQAHGPGFSKILLGDDQVDQLGTVSRPDGRQRVHQQRPQLHQLLRHLGEPAHARDRRRDRAASCGGPAAAARSSGRGPRGVHGARRGRRHLAVDRRRSQARRASPT